MNRDSRAAAESNTWGPKPASRVSRPLWAGASPRLTSIDSSLVRESKPSEQLLVSQIATSGEPARRVVMTTSPSRKATTNAPSVRPITAAVWLSG